VASHARTASKRLQSEAQTTTFTFFCRCPATVPLAKALQLLKGGFSNWLNEAIKPRFEWQQGYGAVSINISHQDQTVAYINSQTEHYRKRNYEEEFVAFLKRHNIDYDPRYVLG
jgi:putative transposase